MFRYSGYGLGIESEWPFPEFQANDTAIDVTIRRSAVPDVDVDTISSSWSAATADGRLYLRHRDIGAFQLDGGSQVRVDPRSGTDDDTLRHYLIGPVFAALLHQRGRLVLHGSAIDIGGDAVAFLGGSGTGKSSLAAAGVRRGHGFIADDVTAVDADGSQTVAVAPPIIKLTRAAADRGGVPGERLPRPAIGKDYYRLPRSYRSTERELQRVYVLDRGGAPAIEAIAPRDAAIELVRHAYVAPLFDWIGGHGSYLEAAGDLASNDRVRRLRTGGEMDSLEPALDLVERDLDDAS